MLYEFQKCRFAEINIDEVFLFFSFLLHFSLCALGMALDMTWEDQNLEAGTRVRGYHD